MTTAASAHCSAHVHVACAVICTLLRLVPGTMITVNHELKQRLAILLLTGQLPEIEHAPVPTRAANLHKLTYHHPAVIQLYRASACTSVGTSRLHKGGTWIIGKSCHAWPLIAPCMDGFLQPVA